MATNRGSEELDTVSVRAWAGRKDGAMGPDGWTTAASASASQRSQPSGKTSRVPPAPNSMARTGPLITCCLILETHVSSSRSRRERWKARVVLTAMKMSCRRSSRGAGLGRLSLGGCCTPWGGGRDWYRRDRSPMHRRVRRAPARPRSSRHCMGTAAGRLSSQVPTSPGPETGQAGALAGARVGQASGRTGSGDVELELPPRSLSRGCPTRRHPPPAQRRSPAPAAGPAPPGRGAEPGRAQRWQSGTQPPGGSPPPASCWGGGGGKTQPSVPGGRQGPSSHATPQRPAGVAPAASARYFPASRPLHSGSVSPGCSPHPASSPLLQAKFCLRFKLSSGGPSSRNPSMVAPPNSWDSHRSFLGSFGLHNCIGTHPVYS